MSDTISRDMDRHMASITYAYLDIVRRGAQPRDCHTFMQVWGSTALGFGGMGGAAMSPAMTVVFIVIEQGFTNAYVYFGGVFAYVVPCNGEVWKAISSHAMPSLPHVSDLYDEV